MLLLSLIPTGILLILAQLLVQVSVCFHNAALFIFVLYLEIGGPARQTKVDANDVTYQMGQAGGRAGDPGDDGRHGQVPVDLMDSKSLLGGDEGGAADTAKRFPNNEQGMDYDSIFKGKPL